MALNDLMKMGTAGGAAPMQKPPEQKKDGEQKCPACGVPLRITLEEVGFGGAPTEKPMGMESQETESGGLAVML